MHPNSVIEKRIVEDLERLLEAGDTAQVRRILLNLHPADIADILDEFDREEVLTLFSLLPDEVAAEVLPELEAEDARAILEALGETEFVRRFLPHLEPDDAVDLIRLLPEEQQQTVLRLITDIPEETLSRKKAEAIRYLVSHQEDTAGALMTTEFVAVPEHYAVRDALSLIRQRGREIDEIYTVYVVDGRGRLQGQISLKDLVVADDETPVRKIMEEVPAVRVDTPAREIVEIAEKFDLVSLPVVDEKGRLVGRITIDDILEYLQEEVKEEINILTGVAEDVEVSDTPWEITRARLPWLLVGLLGGVLNSRIIGQFGDIIRLHPAMAFFMPLIAAMGGNAGIQASAIVVQSLATHGPRELGWRLLGKELITGALIGGITSLMIFTYGLIFQDSMVLTLTVSIALFAVVIIATVMGVVIPITLHKLEIDPAVAMGPFITTLNDLTGMGVYFTIAYLLFNYVFGHP